jgi:hypothetical protein
MATYSVIIPDNKQVFFQEFLDIIGANYEKNDVEYQLSDEHKNILDQRLKESKTSFISAREALSQIRTKHGL